MLLQVLAQVRIELFLARKLGRVAAVLTLGEVTVDDGQLAAVPGVEGCDDKSSLAVFGIGGETLVHAGCRFPVEQGNAVVGLLAVKDDIVAKVSHLLDGKILVDDLGFLQADKFRAMFFDHRLQLVQASPNAVDIKGYDFDGDSLGVLRVTALVTYTTCAIYKTS